MSIDDNELTYKIIGCCYKVQNKLGYGHRERFYQRALAEEFRTEKLTFKRELCVPLIYNDKIIGKYFIDFVVANSIVVELKIHDIPSNNDIAQILGYMKQAKLNLGLLLLFTRGGIKIKRLIL